VKCNKLKPDEELEEMLEQDPDQDSEAHYLVTTKLWLNKIKN